MMRTPGIACRTRTLPAGRKTSKVDGARCLARANGVRYISTSNGDTHLHPAPVISVVIPTHDRARFLHEALDGVFAQAECPPFEVIVVDDASTDDTPAVLARYPHPLRSVRLARNAGVAGARAAGVAEARGTLIAFHDSDDVMLPGRLGALAAYIGAHPEVGAVCANGEVVSAGGTPRGSAVPRALASRFAGRSIGAREILRDGFPFFPQTVLVRRTVLDAAGGIDTDLDWHADWEIGCRLAMVAPVVFLDRAVFRYRLHDDNVTRDRMRMREGFVTAIRRLRERHPDVVAAVGDRWLRRREARHLYRIARARWRGEDSVRARSAIREAVALVPHSLRYRWLSLRVGS
jgi:glycosyltransferase involved in cell wall biosynthesis